MGFSTLSKKQSITIITQFYPPDYAATGQFVYELAHALGKEGYDINVFTGKPGYAFKQADAPREEDADGVRVRRTRAAQISPKRIRGKLINSIFFWLRCAIKLRNSSSRGSHLLITSAPPFLGLIGWFYNKVCGHSYSCLIYDVYPEVAVRLGVVKLDHWIVKLWQFLNSKVWERAESLIVISEPMKELLLSQNKKIADKIYVIPNWADPELIKPIPKSTNWFAEQYSLNNYFVVLYSGNLGRCHDEVTILECIYLLKNHPKVKFVFIGNGAGIVPIEKAIATGDLPNAIKLPYQEREVLPYSLTACDLSLVSLKPNVEGVVAPSKVYGILAAGRPIAAICPEHSYLRQLIDEGNCGCCFMNGDAKGLADYICQLANDHSKVEYLGLNARSHFEKNFTLEKITPLYIEALGMNSLNNQLSSLTDKE